MMITIKIGIPVNFMHTVKNDFGTTSKNGEFRFENSLKLR